MKRAILVYDIDETDKEVKELLADGVTIQGILEDENNLAHLAAIGAITQVSVTIEEG